VLGFHKVVEVGSSVTIAENTSLDIWNALNGLERIGGDLTVQQNRLQNFTGLDDLVTVEGHMIFQQNQGLQTIRGLRALETVGGDLVLYSNRDLIEAKFQASTVGGEIVILANDSLQSIERWPQLTDAGALRVSYNPSLTGLAGFYMLSTLRGDLELIQNDQLETLLGLNALTTIEGNMVLRRHDVLTDISPLMGVTNIGGDVYVMSNIALGNPMAWYLMDTIGEDAIGGSITISGND
jgi:hypothetical protein